MFGIVNLNKPVGWTSRDAVNRVQSLVKPAKVGHAGTLDPLATGVLVVCVGPATRLISHVQQQEKEYHATFLLGRTSPSDDIESEVTEIDDAVQPSLEEIVAQLPHLVGRIEQLPPKYCALKVDGKRAYELARRGEDVKLKSRPVEVYELKILSYDYPELQLVIRCGSGTYVRSIGRDLAESLGTGAVMSALVRTAIGNFRVADALDVEGLDAERITENLQSPLLAVPHLRQIELDQSQLRDIGNGRLIDVSHFASQSFTDGDQVAAIDASGRLAAILVPKRQNMLGPAINFPQAE